MCLLLMAVLAILAPRARAQAVAVVEVDGYVTDPSGQSIAGAQVKIVDTDTNQVHTSVSDATGRYALSNLPVGNYALEASANGFKSFNQTGIVLQVATNPQINIAMQIGSMTESISVTANAAMVETKENGVSQVMNQQAVVDLPLNGRNPTQLLVLTGAGTNTTPTTGSMTGTKNMLGSNASGQFSVAGSQANGVNYLLDGGDNNDAFSNVNLPIPFPDALQEFNVQANALPAQYGLHPGGVVNIVTKSGGNSLHVDFFEFLRNGDLNARQDGTTARDSLKRSQFGGTVGGRIIKDKLFFFGGYQGTRQRSTPATNIAYVPTAATLQGNFSGIDDGQCGKAITLKSPSGVPYPNNQIPVSTFDPAGYKLASTYLPLATLPCGETLYGYPSNNPDDQWLGRIDYVINDKNSFFGRYYVYDYFGQVVFDGKNALTTGTTGNQQRSQTMTIGETYTLTATAVNSFHATFDRRRDNRADAPNLFSPNSLGVNMYDGVSNYTQVSLTGYSGGGFNIGCGTCALAFFDINTYQVADDFTVIRGKHQISFGIDGRKDQFNSVNDQYGNGQFTFNGGTTGDGLADLLVGRFSGLTKSNIISDYLRQTVFAAYVQDAFHATPHLTVNYGIRWEPSGFPYDKQNRGEQFSWPLFLQGWHSPSYPNAPAGLVFASDKAQDPAGNTFTKTRWDTFSPRLGLVWDPTGQGKQTIRASFNLMHDTAMLFYPEQWTLNPPWGSNVTLTSGQFSSPFASYTSNGVTGDPFPANNLFPVGGQYISIPPDLKRTYVMQWNVSYQRQVGTDWKLEVNYLGNASRHLWGDTDINYSVYTGPSSSTSNTAQRRLTYLANPAQGQYFGAILQSDDGVNEEYHGLLAKAEHRMAKNLTVISNFTWSHCIGEAEFEGQLNKTEYQNPTNRAAERGSCTFDHRFIFNTSLVAASPGVGSGFVKLATVNWQLSPIVSLISGQPLILSDGGKDISLSAQALDRPNVILPNQVYPATKTVNEWFNPAAFAVQPAGTFGNLGRNAIYGPGTIQWDMALSRSFKMKERYSLVVRSDFFNIMNHGNWNNPGLSIASPASFGVITTFGSPRIIQMSMKLLF
ncbi:MAG: carboxypeptidase regulatory-like domain-containing protein [Bryobacteraceae bacterium]